MGKKHQEGFTLIELLVLMMVLALTLSLGVPTFTAMAANARMSAAANTLVSALHAARTEAITRNRSITLCATEDWAAATPACTAGTEMLAGWVMFVDDNADGAVDPDETILQTGAPVDESILDQPGTGADQVAPQYLSFRADGLLQDIPGLGVGIANFQLCDYRGDQDTGAGRAAGRWIALSAGGRPTLFDMVTDLQSANNPLNGC